MIITITALKGGVGKTTTSIHLAAYLQENAPTLLIDANKGEVIMDSDLALDKSEIEAGWILTCQARCASKEVEISYQE